MQKKYFNNCISNISEFKSDHNDLYEKEDYNDPIEDNIIQQIVILLYLTRKLDFKVNLDDLDYAFDNRCIKYLKIVSPMLNLRELQIENYEHNLSFSLEFVELLLSFPNLQFLNIHFIPTDIEFKIPEKTLKINELTILVGNNENKTYNIININKLLKMCPELKRLDLSCNNISTDNKNLVKLGEILNQCNNLTHLILSNFTNISEDNKPLNFINVILNCHNLIILDLSQNKIRDEEAIEIANIVSKRTISHLNLSYNKISGDAVLKIVKILSNSTTLTHLILSCNKFGIDKIKEEEKIEEIKKELSQSKTLTKFEVYSRYI